MKTSSIRKVACFIAMIAVALMTAGYVEAGGLGDRGGGTTFRNQGAAAGGNLSAKRSGKNAAPTRKSQAGATAQKPAVKPAKAGQATASGAQKSGTKTSKATTGSAQQAQTKSQTNQQNRQQTMSNNQQNRQQTMSNNQAARQDAIDDHNDWDNDDCLTENCNGGAFLAGAAIGAATTAIVTQPSQPAPAPAATTTTTTTTTTAAPPPAGLPCDPAVSEIEGITYYACDQDYYILAYGAAGPTYTPVPPPQ